MAKAGIVYFGDPMCSWCWGLTKNLDELINHYKDHMSFRMVMGGLRPGGGDAWNDEYKNMLKGHWEHVAEASGQPFNHGLFDKEDFNYDTEPPSRAVRVIRDMNPAEELPFYQSVQHHFYAESQDPGKLEFYIDLCEKHDIDLVEFARLFESEKYKELTRLDFAYAQQVGAKSFPTVVLEHADQLTAITIGFNSFENMKQIVENVMNE